MTQSVKKESSEKLNTSRRRFLKLGSVHAFMREMDIFFGYGKVDDPERVRKFWKMGAKI